MRRLSVLTAGTLLTAGLVVAGAAGIAGAHATKSTLPTVTSVSPDHGPLAGGTIVTIKGKNVISATAVDFDASPAATFTPKGSDSLVATSPAEVGGSVAVTVTNPSGTSSSVVTAADAFTYTGGPTIQSVSPRIGATTGGTKVTIAGADFTGVTAVDFGSTPATFTFDSSQAISAIAPASPGNAPGEVNVTVTVGAQTSPLDPADGFTYALRAPIVSLLSPSGGPVGQQVPSRVRSSPRRGHGGLRSRERGDHSVLNSKTILATAPAGSGTVDVTVTDSKGTSNSEPFTYTVSDS